MSGTFINQIQHYQKSIERCSGNEKRMLHCIEKLYMLPVTVQHLQETGVGRTINALRKFEGAVGDAAKALVAKWKTMVVDEESSDGDDTGLCLSDISERYSDNSDSSIDKNFQNQSARRNSRNEGSKKIKKSELSHNSVHHEQSLPYKSEQQSSTVKNNKNNMVYNEDNIDQYLISKTNKRNSDLNHKFKRKRKLVDTKNFESEKTPPIKIGNSTHNYSNSEFNSETTKYLTKSPNSQSKILFNNKINAQKTQKRRASDKCFDKMRTQNSIIDKSEDEKITVDMTQSNNDLKMKLSNSQASTSEITDVKKKKKLEKSGENNKSNFKKTESVSSKYAANNNSKLPQQKTHDIRKEESQCSIILSSSSNDIHSQRKSKNQDSTEKKNREKQERRKEDSEDRRKMQRKKRERIRFNGHEGIDCNSGTSFAEALGMCADSGFSRKKNLISLCKTEKNSLTYSKLKIKTGAPKNDELLCLLSPNIKLEPLRVDLESTLPEISPNYKPLPLIPANHRKQEERKALDDVIYSKTARTKVYSGNKASYTSVPTLYELCIRVLIENIEALEFTGGVPYYIIKPVLERATADQLFMIEHYNPYLIEDTDELWKFQCNREFRNKDREEMESWREMYMRCLDEREAKLKLLTANIKQSIDKSLPVRSTIMAYVDDVVKPPRNVLKKQVKYGTAKTSASDIKKQYLISGNTTNISVPPLPTSKASGILKKNKAPLMAKALQLIKGRYKR